MEKKVVGQRITGLRRMTKTEAVGIRWVGELPMIVILDNGMHLIPASASEIPSGLIIKDSLTGEWEVVNG